MRRRRHDVGSGHREWFRELSGHREQMIQVADRVLRDTAAAEDLVQDVLFDLWRRPEAFDASRASLRSYVLMVTRSRALDRWRNRAARAAAVERAVREAALEPAFAASAADVAIRRDETGQLTRALDDLPDDQREALLLAYGRGFSASEVARVVGIPVGTAKSRLRLGLRRARLTLTRD